jgi:hypothetical protein
MWPFTPVSLFAEDRLRAVSVVRAPDISLGKMLIRGAADFSPGKMLIRGASRLQSGKNADPWCQQTSVREKC